MGVSIGEAIGSAITTAVDDGTFQENLNQALVNSDSDQKQLVINTDETKEKVENTQTIVFNDSDSLSASHSPSQSESLGLFNA